jgi:hypothetical protein
MSISSGERDERRENERLTYSEENGDVGDVIYERRESEIGKMVYEMNDE